MAKRTILLTFAIFAVCHGSDGFSELFRPTNVCSGNCSEIYELSELLEGCDRGCRFHVIQEFIADDSNATLLNASCHNSCVEAYGETSSNTEACKKGCEFQAVYIADQKEKEDDEGPSIHLLSPFMQVHAVYSSFVGAVHVIRSSLITYFISDDNKIVAVESEPEIVLGIDPEAAEGNAFLEAEQQTRQLSESEDSGEPSVVKCVSRQIGVPPYILVASVVALIVFTLYVIVAFCSTSSPKAKAYANEKSLKVDPMALPVKLVRPEDLTRLSLTEEEDLQAPALPTKVKLPDSLI